jgi:magnesium-transporting ATPase (P-type)
MLQQVQPLTTPLLRQIDGFSRWLSVALLILAIVTFALGTLWREQDPAQTFMMVVALTVAAIPEGLPAIMTVILALGVQRMARQNAIVRRLPAVETLGSVTVICSDKTGTLTRNEMTVRRLVCADRIIDVSGVGYAPAGGFHLAGAPLAIDQALLEIGRAALLCNDARLEEDAAGNWLLHGDPTEGALATLALKTGLAALETQAELPRSDAIPFESEHRFMATLHHDHSGHGLIYLKGAPERLLEMCSQQRAGDGDQPLDADFWRRQATDLAAHGLRLLAIASRPAAAEQRSLSFADVEQGFTLLAQKPSPRWPNAAAPASR